MPSRQPSAACLHGRKYETCYSLDMLKLSHVRRVHVTFIFPCSHQLYHCDVICCVMATDISLKCPAPLTL